MTEEAKATYEARYCPDMPTDCCDYGVISHETGKEVCRVWDRDDAERITALLNTRQPTPAISEDDAQASLARQLADIEPNEYLKAAIRKTQQRIENAFEGATKVKASLTTPAADEVEIAKGSEE